MNKKGLIMTFVLMGIIIVVAFSLILVMFREVNTIEKDIEEQYTAELEVSPIRVYVEKCLEQTAKQTLLDIGLNGMYMDSPNGSRVVFVQGFSAYNDSDRAPIYFLIQTIPYYVYEGQFNVPSMDVIELEYAKGIDDSLNSCIDSLEVFEEQGFTFKFRKREIEVDFGDNDVFVNMVYPIEIIRQENVYSIESFGIILDFDFKRKYELMSLFMDEQKEYPGYYNYGKLVELAAKNGFRFESDNLEYDIIKVSMIFDEDKELLKEPFRYDFAMKFDWSNNVSQ